MIIAGEKRHLYAVRRARLEAHGPAPALETHPAIAATSATDIDLRPLAALVKDQGGSGSCEAHRTSGGLETAFRAQGKPLGWIPSEQDLYRNARAIDRAAETPEGLELPPLQDVGASTGSMMRAIKEYGIRPRRTNAKDGRNSDVELETMNDEPKLDELEEDAHHVVVGEYEISSTQTEVGLRRAEIVTKIRKALNANMAVSADFFVDTACGQWNPMLGPIPAPNMSDPNGGWHAVYVVAIFQFQGKTRIVFRNSWGVMWGLHGDGEADESWLDAVVEWHVLDAQMKEAA